VARRAAAVAGAGGGAMTEAPQPHGGAPPTSHGATAPRRPAAGKLFPDIIALLHFNSTCFFIVPLSSVLCVYSLLTIEAPFLVLQTYYFTMRNAELPII